MRRVVSNILFAVALVLAQAGAFAHALSHFGDQAGDPAKGHAPQSSHCDVCHAFAGADTADAPAAGARCAPAPAAPCFSAHGGTLVAASEPPPYSGRAPPPLS
ncbi:MAG: hypothetical protein N2544_01540 [Burkholderiales bacterium]|nr:hypothetical protein [Burkholderiales bacterium]